VSRLRYLYGSDGYGAARVGGPRKERTVLESNRDCVTCFSVLFGIGTGRPARRRPAALDRGAGACEAEGDGVRTTWKSTKAEETLLQQDKAE
jgi:hypothetical protein